MATVTLDRMVYTRILSEELTEGGRTAQATVAATGIKDGEGVVTKSSIINMQTPSNMTEAELSSYQVFVGGLDEIAAELEAALYVEPGP